MYEQFAYEGCLCMDAIGYRADFIRFLSIRRYNAVLQLQGPTICRFLFCFNFQLNSVICYLDVIKSDSLPFDMYASMSVKQC